MELPPTTPCSYHVAQQLDARATNCGTVSALMASLAEAGWVDAITGGAPQLRRPAARKTVGAFRRWIIDRLSRTEAVVLVTHRHVLAVDGRHRCITDTAATSDRRNGRDSRKVKWVLWIERKV